MQMLQETSSLQAIEAVSHANGKDPGMVNNHYDNQV